MWTDSQGTSPLTAEQTAKFWSKVQKSDGCWLWTGRLESDGYALMTVRYRRERVHRISWRLTNGEIPSGLMVCHRCDVRHCVRPDHLFLGTGLDNQLDAMQKGRLKASRWADVTHCPHGHEFTAENTTRQRVVYKRKDGSVRYSTQRRCRECTRIKNAKRNRT